MGDAIQRTSEVSYDKGNLGYNNTSSGLISGEENFRKRAEKGIQAFFHFMDSTSNQTNNTFSA